MSKTVKEIAEEIGVSKQAVFKRMKREPLSTGLQGLTTTVDGRLIVSVDGEKLIKQAFSRCEPSTTDNQLTAEVDGLVDGLVDGSSTKSEEKTAEVDGQNRLYEILERELQAKNEQIAALQAELSKERQHNREKDRQLLDTLSKLAESQAALVAGQTAEKQKQLAETIIEGAQRMDGGADRAEPEPQQPRSWWRRFFGGYNQ